MNVYIALGGIGCRNLALFEKNNPQHKYYYFDSNNDVFSIDTNSPKYIITKQTYGCFHSCIGKDSFKQEIFNGNLPKIKCQSFLENDLNVSLVISAFGGFGAAIAYDFIDYYGTKINAFRKASICKNNASFTIIAFPLNYWPKEYPEPPAQYEMNMVELINEYRSKTNRFTEWYSTRCPDMPCISLYLPYLSGLKLYDLSSLIGLSHEQLSQLDIKESFYYTPHKSKESKDVFISYSSYDEETATLL